VPWISEILSNVEMYCFVILDVLYRGLEDLEILEREKLDFLKL
jgi:hypothetical protein